MVPNPTWIVGCGNLGGALVKGWRSAGVDLTGAVIVRPSGEPVESIPAVTDFASAGAAPRLVILAFKPQQLSAIAPKLAEFVSSRTTVVSLLAGVEVATLRNVFPEAGAVVRALPNLPVAIRRGVVALYGETNEGTRDQVSQLFAPLGFTLWTNNEAGLAAVGAVAGAGPAYVARFITALAKAGVERGLSEDLANTVALETVLGTSWMAAAGHESMADIVRRVASPNGTTEAGLAVLDERAALDRLVSATIDAAARRGSELAEEARTGNLAVQSLLP